MPAHVINVGVIIEQTYQASWSLTMQDPPGPATTSYDQLRKAFEVPVLDSLRPMLCYSLLVTCPVEISTLSFPRASTCRSRCSFSRLESFFVISSLSFLAVCAALCACWSSAFACYGNHITTVEAVMTQSEKPVLQRNAGRILLRNKRAVKELKQG